jgi:predicted phosphodiesterase
LLIVVAASCCAQSPAKSGLTIVVISDLNDAYGSVSYSPQVHTALDYIERSQPDLVICAGDMVAGQNLKLSEDNLRAMWRGFDELVLRRIRHHNIPFAFTFGNHDGPSNRRYEHERKIAVEFWQKNRPELDYVDNSNFPEFYSFTFKGLFIAVIDASTSQINQTQRDWLQKQLQSEAARAARLRAVVGHLPLYAIAKGRDKAGDVLADADALRALLRAGGVDYYISGHHHAFYISKKDDLKMLSVGALGGGPRQYLNSELPPVKTLTTLQLADSSSSFSLLVHDVSNGMKVVKLSDLPKELHGHNGVSLLCDSDCDSNKPVR